VKVYLRTFGCRANHYDTEAVRALVSSAGHEIVARATDADVAVYNGCAVTADAEAELRKVVRRDAKRRPALRSVVMGCAASNDEKRAPALRVRSLPTVESVVPGADLVAVAEALEIDVPIGAVLTTHQTGTRALLRIQDGCDAHCTFCATTLARGANRSRSADDVVREAATLAERHAEIVITGIHIGTYGDDIEGSLGALMTRLVAEVPVVRFRLSSIEATEIDEALSRLLIEQPDRLVPHVHAPLQSGADGVLKRMGRHWYTSASYAAAVERLAGEMPILGLGADVITGFPGETATDHAATVALVESLPFTYLHVFPYSARPGTAAPKLDDQVASGLADERATELRDIASRRAAAYAASRVGGWADSIVIGGAERREALTGDYLTAVPAGGDLPRGARFTGRLELAGSELIVRVEARGSNERPATVALDP
jgi:threonylcarbamoyladenosine tRNA methylthiotransferase MtaB